MKRLARLSVLILILGILIITIAVVCISLLLT